ncbi:oxidoreductase [Ensifer adhaerens]|uniref:Oxidoreductase n=1 Tax=Ensifer adhaerens TaxID=106592 RepID=A0A0L8C6G1_ENSAD|nr:Gfo/Idh/MocA family oxidoreductase [Ensifer adhaerens]KOF22378.1 oxidoreductase [Ensifer adhaerens]
MRLLILGTGWFAQTHAENFSKIEGVMIAAAVDQDPVRLKAFCEKYGIANEFSSLEEALAWNEFDAVTNVTPDSAHYPTTLQCIAAGKHVFCEKPLATNREHAHEMADKIEGAGLVGMVNLTYRNVPELQAARQIVTSGQIGAVKHVEASYLQSWLVSKAWGDWRTESQWLWRLSKKHGSHGTLGDVGIHILDFASYGSNLEIEDVYCRLHTFEKAEGNKIGEYELDANDSFAMTVSFKNGALGVVHSSRFATGHMNDLRLRVYGDRGAVEVQHREDGSHLLVCLGDDVETGTWNQVAVEPVRTNFQRFVEAVSMGITFEPSFRHAARIQDVLDIANLTHAERRAFSLSRDYDGLSPQGNALSGT